MNPETTALVLIEFQNDFTTEGGALHGAVAGGDGVHRHARATRPAPEAARAARRHDDPRPIAFADGLRRDHRAPLRHPQGRRRLATPSSRAPGAPTSSPTSRPPTATSSSRASAASTRSDRPTSTSSCGARASRPWRWRASSPTAASSRPCARAYEKGFEVITLTDCVGATSQAEHDNAITYDYPMFSKPMTADEYVGTLRGAAVTADSSRGY